MTDILTCRQNFNQPSSHLRTFYGNLVVILLNNFLSSSSFRRPRYKFGITDLELSIFSDETN